LETKEKELRASQMKWIRSISVLFILFLCVGCVNTSKETNNVESSEQLNNLQESVNKELAQLENEIMNKDKKIIELQQELESIRTQHKETTEEMRNTLMINDYLLKQLPNIVQKQGYINELIKNNNGEYDLTIDFAKMVEDDSAPNGFHLENDRVEKEKILAKNEIDIYTLDGAKIKFSSFEELIKNEHKGLYNLFFMNNQLVLIVEQYLP
jgi:septal ring factor EnvC (AmiA/AmiB activator)